MSVQFTVGGQDAGALSFLTALESKFQSTGKTADDSGRRMAAMGQSFQRLAGPANSLATAMGSVGGSVISSGLAMASAGPQALALGAAVAGVTLIIREFNKAAEEKARHYERLATPRLAATEGIKAQTAAYVDLLNARRAVAMGIPAEVQAREKENRAIKENIEALRTKIAAGEQEERDRQRQIAAREKTMRDILAGAEKGALPRGDNPLFDAINAARDANVRRRPEFQAAQAERQALVDAQGKSTRPMKALRDELAALEEASRKAAEAERNAGIGKAIADKFRDAGRAAADFAKGVQRDIKEGVGAFDKWTKELDKKRKAWDDLNKKEKEVHDARGQRHREEIGRLDKDATARRQAMGEMLGQPPAGAQPAAAAGGSANFVAGAGANTAAFLFGGPNRFAGAGGGAAGGAAADAFAGIDARANRDARDQARRNIANEIDVRRVEARIAGGDVEAIDREGRRRRAAAGRGEGDDFAKAQQDAFQKGVEQQAAQKGLQEEQKNTVKELANAFQELKAQADKDRAEWKAIGQFVNGGRKQKQKRGQ